MASGTIKQVREPHPASAEVFDWDRGNEDRAATWLMVGRDRGGRELVIGVVWVDVERRALRAVAGWPA